MMKQMFVGRHSIFKLNEAFPANSKTMWLAALACYLAGAGSKLPHASTLETQPHMLDFVLILPRVGKLGS